MSKKNEEGLLIAYFDGIEVAVLTENCFRNEKGTPIAVIVKTDETNGRPVPAHLPFDNLEFPNGTKERAKKIMEKILTMKRITQKEKKKLQKKNFRKK